MSERLRLFVALELPVAVREELAAWCERVAVAGVRRVPAENLHLTLAFLGSRSADEAAAVAALLPRLAAASAVGALSTAAALWLPPRRPGVLSVALGADPGLTALHEGVVAALAEAVGLSPERRPFRPHVTVGRVARGARVRAEPLAAPVPLTFAAQALTLYRSHTDRGGARYEPLARESLGGS